MKQVNKESGITLIEVLATLAITGIIGSVLYAVFFQTVHIKVKTQSHNELRQEANIVMTQLRSIHENGDRIWYSSGMLYTDKEKKNPLATETNYLFTELLINGTKIVSEQSIQLLSTSTFKVAFTMKDHDQNKYDLETVLPGTTNQPIAGEIVKPSPPSTAQDFYTYLVKNNVFVYGSQFEFQGNQVNGPNAAIIVRGNLLGSQLNGGSLSNVSNIDINGPVNIDGGSASLGSRISPGTIYVNGDVTLWGGTRHIYGDVYVNGNLKLKDAIIHGNVYVQGNVELDWTPTIEGNARIYYKGTIKHPPNYHQSILDKVILKADVPKLTKSYSDIPPLKDSQWYRDHGYTQTIKPDNMKLFGNSITVRSYNDSGLGRYVDTFTNAIIVSQGDINIDSGDLKMTGVLFAPNGKVTFSGKSFEGVVITRDGFYVKSGGTTVTFKGIEQYIRDLKDFPLKDTM
ncbi:prepilin-type N-terminal cleavage/methylation domain-containing protein [Bacillus cihuensis]|uniref:prepilin-type N-terminal cleavage/methylation domain-containing protein n=1 Tax=Bacillus cihuensis TaxID=1208599 RepID=UPI000423D995|nr:prepilin-type N-terminal cleavage/methylation domain-containing protein [Bacillus cihuensis]